MTIEERKAWERRQRQNRIIDIAQGIFFEKGYDNATILDIAGAAGYSKRSIYLYFKDKEEIFLAVVLKGLTLMHDRIAEAASSTEAEKTGLDLIGSAFYGFSLEHPEYLKLIMLYESDTCVYYKTGKSAVSHEGFAFECQSKTDAIAETITTVIERGMKSGAIQTTLTPIQLMLVLWGHVLGMMQIIAIRREHFEDAYGIDYQELFNISQQIMERGISGKQTAIRGAGGSRNPAVDGIPV